MTGVMTPVTVSAMPTLNYTTTVAASKTIAEIQTLLARHGAIAVATHYENGQAQGVSFQVVTKGRHDTRYRRSRAEPAEDAAADVPLP